MPSRSPLLRAIEAQATERPERCALADGRVRLDWAGLHRFSGAFASHLHAQGCRPGDRVAMLANRRTATVAAIAGTFEAGCVHVPLDPRMPAARLRYILEDVAPALVVAEDALRDAVAASLPKPAPILSVGDLQPLIDEARAPGRPQPDGAAGAPFDPDAPAYCIYTSGSTGRPKGVLIRHRSIVDFFEGTREIYDVRADSVCASFSPLHFDVFLMDMLFPLSEGATLHVHDEVVFPDLLFETIRANDVTHFSAWGRMLGLIAQARVFDVAPLPHVQTILTGTSVPDVKTVQRWLAKNDRVQVLNAYGPTEATCAATAHPIREREPDRRELYPIGKPLRHVRIRLVDEEDARIDAPGVPGELWLAGSQLMTGYWNRPEETAAAFAEAEGERWYRTGDVCTLLPDGSLCYQGRRDDELNLDGYRVHASEIQRVICGVPRVHAAEVVLLESPYGEPVLAAGVLLDPGARVETGAIRARLEAELPAYMIPRHVEILEEFPQLSSGKTDRKMLAATLEGRIRGRGPAEGPRAVEARLREILETVIGIEDLDRDRCFLEAGGNSANVVEVLEAIEQELGVNLDPRLFFEEETSTLAALGAAIHEQRLAERVRS